MFVSQEITIWRDFHSYWMDEPMIPTYVIRYEDLLSNKKDTLLGLFRFLLNEKDLEGTLIEALIEHHAKSKTLKQVYKPRKGKANCNKHLYNESQIKKIKQEAGQILKRLGYVNEHTELSNDTESSNNTGYYSDDEDIESSVEHNCETITRNGQETEVKTRYRREKINEIMLDRVCSDEYRNNVKELSDLSSIQVGFPDDDIMKKSDKYPEGRSRGKFRKSLHGYVDVVLPDGSIKKAEKSHKSENS